MTAVFPGGATNTYVPSTEATNNMVVDFSRNPSGFAVNKYVQLVPVTKDVGYYTKMTVEEAGRVFDTDNDLWADGDDMPSDRGHTESFEFLAYNTKRRVQNFRIGYKAAQQASWELLAQHARIKAQQAMTRRTQQAVKLATTSGNWDASHTIAVSSISGVTGKWDVSTTARKDIKRSLDYALEIIFLDTLGGVNLDDIFLVISPKAARLMSISQEIVDHVKGSPDALAEIKGGLGPNAAHGLPSRLYGVNIVVENAVRVTSVKGATKAASYVLGYTTPFLCSRPGGQVAATDSNAVPRHATFSQFMFEEMTVESLNDVDNRVNKGRVVEDYDSVITSPLSGFLFTAAIT